MKRIFASVLALSFTFMHLGCAVTQEARTPAAAAEQNTSFTDIIEKVRQDDEGVVVLFAKHSGSYYLKNDTADFDNLKKKLESNLNKTVTVTADPALNIIEVK